MSFQPFSWIYKNQNVMGGLLNPSPLLPAKYRVKEHAILIGFAAQRATMREGYRMNHSENLAVLAWIGENMYQ